MRLLAFLAAAVVALGFAATVAAEPAVDIVTDGKQDRVGRSGGVDLRRCLALADRNHPNLHQARAKVAKVRAQLTEARFAPFSQFRLYGGVGLAPTVRGNNVFSPNTDVSLTSNLGVAWRAGLEGVIPVWTFGKITNLWDAAEAQIDLKEAEAEVARDAVRFDVRKAYFGLMLARDALALLDDGQKRVERAVAELEQGVEEDDDDPVDLYKLQTYAAELYARRAEAERFERIALAGLRFYTGEPKLEIVDEPLRPARHRLRPLEAYIDAARLHRPEMRMARAGVAAREAQLRLSRSQLFPDLGLGLNAGLSTAPEVADQINPFVKDGGNYFHYGAALVVRWQLDIVPKVARVWQAEADLQEVLALNQKANVGVAAEVEEAYAEVVDWQKRRAAYQKAEKYAKRWLVTVQQSIDIGTAEDKDLTDPAKTYAQQRYNVLNATMEMNMALCKLGKVTGWDAIAPDGR